MRKVIAIACAILLPFALLHSTAGAKSSAWPISVKVVDLDNTPIKNAYVALWNHTATPSVMVTQTKSDGQGLATLTYRGLQDAPPDYVHLSVMVTAAGYGTSSWHWSLDSQEATMSALTPEQITITLKHSERPKEVIDNSKTGRFVQPADYPGEIRYRLTWWDYNTYKNQLTAVAVINQVGHLESSFAFQTKADTKMGIRVKGLLGIWEPSGSVTVSKSVGAGLGWNLAASQNDGNYVREICKTQYDYCLEEYAVEQYQTDGDIWRWVRIDTQYKFYAKELNVNATPDADFETTTTPPSGTSWTGNRISPQGTKTKNISEMDEIAVALRVPVLFVEATIDLKHITSATSVWQVHNTADYSSGKYYEFGNGADKSWVFRPY